MKLDKKPSPPSWIGRLLSRLLDNRLYEAVVGDLDEKYQKRIAAGEARWKASLLYFLESIGFIRMTEWSKLLSIRNPGMMYRSYCLIAIRNISRDRLYVFLNISGLAIGMASFISIYAYVNFELSYDRFHSNADRIYRITEETLEDTQLVRSAMNHSPLAPIIAENVKDVKNVVRVFPHSYFFNSFVKSTPDRLYKEYNFCFADSSFFETFSFESLSGALDDALKAPYSVVITRKTAEKYFGSVTNALNKSLTFQNDEDAYTFNVSGIIENIPSNSHFSFDFLASFSSLDKFMPWYKSWYHPSMFIYVEMEKSLDAAELDRRLQSVAPQHQPDHVREEKRNYLSQRMLDIHLHSRYENEWEANSNYDYLQIYIVTGLFILVIACVNFMNMATARSARRAREVGVRKVFGSRKGQLITQFLSESLIYSVVSFTIALVIAEGSLRFLLTSILDKELSLASILNWQSVLYAAGFIVVISIFSGLYPSYHLSAFRPTKVLKGKLDFGSSSTTLRKGLVGFQIFISCVLISATFIILRQVDFLQNKNLGFDRDHLVTLKLSDRHAQKNYHVLKDALLSETTVSSVALCSTLPGTGNFQTMDIVPEGSEAPVSIKSLGGDEGLVSTYNFELLQGRDFSVDIQTDQKAAFIINESAAKKLGWNDPIGKELTLTVYTDGHAKHRGKVIGLIKDFHFQSLHSPIEPLLLYINKHPYYADHLAVRFEIDNLASAVELLKEKWKVFNPDKPIDLQFVNDDLNDLYASELKISKVFNVLAIISIFVACLGLFGLSAFIAERRTKEVGIRKIMGADLVQIIGLQLKEFVLMVIAANAVVWPFVWWWAENWLNGFAYHVKIDLIIFIITLAGAVLLVTSTLLYHAVRMAKANPVTALRYE